MDITKDTTTGTLLGSYERVVDLGIFDGRLVTGQRAAATTSRAAAAAAVVAPMPSRSIPLDRRTTRLLAIAGAIIAVAGIVAVGFAGFQLYGTNIVAARHQDNLEVEFEARRALGPAPVVAAGAITEIVDPADYEDADDVPVLVGTITQAPLTPPPTLEWAPEGAPERGAPVGRLVIPQIEFDWVVIEGIGVGNLQEGPGHMPNSAMPGQLGNAVISGHRTTYGSPFSRLDELEPGDRFTFETLIGTHTYEVVSIQVVLPSEAWVTSQWAGGWMTFTTCNPKFSSRQRLIVFSKLVEGPNAAAIDGEYHPEYLPPAAPPGYIPVDTTWLPATTTTTIAPTTTTTEAATTTTTTGPVTTTTTVPEDPTETTTTEATTTTTIGGG